MLVFGIAFGLIVLVMTYVALKGSTEGRSKAAEEQVVYKQWEFNGPSSEGWDTVGQNTSSVHDGFLSFLLKKLTLSAGIRNTEINTVLPYGLKTIAISLSVGPESIVMPTPVVCPPPPKCDGKLISADVKDRCPVYTCVVARPTTTPVKTSTGFGSMVRGATQENDQVVLSRSIQSQVICPEEMRQCPGDVYVGRSGSQCNFSPCPIGGNTDPSRRRVVGFVYYKLSNKKVFEKPLEFNTVADGKFHDIRVNLPQIESGEVERLRVVLVSGVKIKDQVKIDWIRLLGAAIKPTVTRLPMPSNTPPPPSPVFATYTPTPSRVPSPVYATYTPTPMSQPVHIISVTSPNGGETVTVGQQYAITWKSSHTFSNVTIYYVTDTGNSGLIATNAQDTGSYTWNVSTAFGSGAYKIFINGDINGYNYAKDSSNAFFTIVQ